MFTALRGVTQVNCLQTSEHVTWWRVKWRQRWSLVSSRVRSPSRVPNPSHSQRTSSLRMTLVTGRFTVDMLLGGGFVVGALGEVAIGSKGI